MSLSKYFSLTKRLFLWGFLSLLILYPLFFFVKESLLLVSREGFSFFKTPSLKEAFFFSFKQSLISSFISVFLALLNVFLLRKTHKVLRKFLFAILFIPSGISVIVGILSFLALFGKQGLLGYYIPFFSQNFYSLKTLILFNTLYNFSFLSLIFYSISLFFPYSLLEKAKRLGASHSQRFLSVLLPLGKSHIFFGFSLSFIFCFMSFYPLLFLGAKENFLSPEVLIYQKINREFNLGEASFIAFCEWFFIFLFILYLLYQRPLYEPTLIETKEKKSLLSGIFATLISSFSLIIWLPLLLKVFKNMKLSLFVLQSSLKAFYHSFLLGMISSFLIICLCIWIIESLRESLKNKKNLLILFSPLGLSPLMTSYIYSQFLVNWLGFSTPLPSLIISQIVLGFPLVLYLLLHEMREFQTLPQKAEKLGATKFQTFKSVNWPIFKKSYFKGFFLNFLFSFGNLSTGFLYLPKDFETVPLKIYRYLQFYRVEEALILSGLFIIFLFLIFFIYERISKRL